MSEMRPTGEGFFSGKPTHVADPYFNKDVMSWEEYVKAGREFAKSQGVHEKVPRPDVELGGKEQKVWHRELAKLQNVGFTQQETLAEWVSRQEEDAVMAEEQAAEADAQQAEDDLTAKMAKRGSRRKSRERRGILAPLPTARKSILGIG